jgi:hypothetical protein
MLCHQQQFAEDEDWHWIDDEPPPVVVEDWGFVPPVIGPLAIQPVIWADIDGEQAIGFAVEWHHRVRVCHVDGNQLHYFRHTRGTDGTHELVLGDDAVHYPFGLLEYGPQVQNYRRVMP